MDTLLTIEGITKLADALDDPETLNNILFEHNIGTDQSDHLQTVFSDLLDDIASDEQVPV